MKFLIATIYFVSFSVLAKPIINLSYNELNLAGKLIEIDASSSIDDGGEDFKLRWELLDSPASSQTQVKVLNNRAVNLTLDREGIYSLRVTAINSSGESSEKLFSLYSTKSVGATVYGPITREPSVLCKMSFGFFGCDVDHFDFEISNLESDYTLEVTSKNIARGLVIVNDAQVIFYNDHTGDSSEAIVKEVTLENQNSLSFDMTSSEIDSEYTFSILKNIMPTDSNNSPTGSDVSALVSIGSERVVNIQGSDIDGDNLEFKVVDQPKLGSASINSLGELTYTANNFNGEVDKLVISIRDDGNIAKETLINVNLTITDNQFPIILAENLNSNTESVFQKIEFLDSVDQNLTVSIKETPQNGTYDFDQVSGIISYTPNANFLGVDSFIISAIDDGVPSLETTRKVFITVEENTQPIYNGITTFDIQENNSEVIDLTAMDMDANQIIGVRVLSAPINGDFNLESGNFYRYSPTTNYSGADQAIVQFFDNGNPESTLDIIFNFNVIATGNQPPIFNGYIDYLARNHHLPAQTEIFLSEIPSDTDGSVIKYVFNYGDGNEKTVYPDANNQNPNGYHHHNYKDAGTYITTVEIYDNEGAKTTFTQEIDIQGGYAPIAKVIPSTISGPAPLTVDFDGSLSNDSGETDPSDMFYYWDIEGDVFFGRGLNQISKTFTLPGTYNVSYDFQDGFHRRGGEITIYVDSPISNREPQSVIVVDKTSGDAPLTVNFDGMQSINYDRVDGIVSYEWDFDDYLSVSNISTDGTIAHTFTKPGTYNVKLKVKNDEGFTRDAFYTIYVNNPNPINFDFLAYDIQGTTVEFTTYTHFQFDALSERSFLVDWGDGSKDIVYGKWFNHTYSSEGQYDVEVILERYDGSLVTRSKQINVSSSSVLPQAEISHDGRFKIPYVNTYEILNENFSLSSDFFWFLEDGEQLSGAYSDFQTFDISHNNKGLKDFLSYVTTSDGFSRVFNYVIQPYENEYPIANAHLNSCVGQAPLSVTVDTQVANHSSGINNRLVRYVNPQNLSFNTVQSSYNYEESGEYYIETLFSSNSGEESLMGYNVFVNDQPEPAGNMAPTVQSQYGFYDATRPRVMFLDQVGSFDPDGEIACYEVDIVGFGKFTSYGNLEVEFPNLNETFTVNVTGFDNWGRTQTSTFNMVVGVTPTPLRSQSLFSERNFNNDIKAKIKRNEDFINFVKRQSQTK